MANRTIQLIVDVEVFDGPEPGDEMADQWMIERALNAFVPHPDDTRRTGEGYERIAVLVTDTEVRK